jgi:flagellar motor component MotA
MKRKTKLIICLAVGIVLALGPIWGIIGTVVGMLLSFGNLDHPVIIVSAIKLAKAGKEGGISNQALRPTSR